MNEDPPQIASRGRNIHKTVSFVDDANLLFRSSNINELNEYSQVLQNVLTRFYAGNGLVMN